MISVEAHLGLVGSDGTRVTCRLKIERQRAGRADVLFIDLRLTATVERARVDVRTFDQLREPC